MTQARWIHEALAANTRRAIQTLEAMMQRPPEDDLSRRLIAHIAELLEEKRALYARLRQKDAQIADLTRRLAEVGQ